MTATSVTIIVIVLLITAVRGFITGWREQTVSRGDWDSVAPAGPVDHYPGEARTLERRGDGVWVEKSVRQ